MKQRFSSLDVKVIAHELSSSLTDLRVHNIYDLSSRIFLFKFHKPDHREQLVVDSGFRAHLTDFARATATAPSPFVARLRKFLRTRRVTSISQVGTDRILEFQFSGGQYRLFLEFYAGGNVVLTDADLNILTLLRNVNEGAEHERLRVGLQYNLSLRQNYGGVPPLTKERVKAGLQKSIDRQKEEENKSKKRKVKPGDMLRKALAVSITEFPPMLIDHALRVEQFDSTTLPSAIVEDDALLDKVMSVLDTAGKVLEEIMSSKVTKGYILAVKEKPKAGSEPSESDKLLYDDFHPFRPRQFEEDPKITMLEFETFGKTVDEFFSSIEGQKLESRLQEREEQANQRLDHARQAHARRIGGLQEAQELNIRKAQTIEANLERVEEAIAAVNGLIAQGMDWVDIARLIEMEQSRGNIVAQTIKLPLKLFENTVTLLLGEQVFEEDESDVDEDESTASESEDEDEPQSSSNQASSARDQRLTIDIDLGLTPWANASQYYDQKKFAAEKESKTLQAADKALKSAEQKITADLKKGLKQEKEVLRPVRKQFWFEKFIYFVSSEGYLVLGGRDVQQNEILYNRHLKKGDIYVHADLPGAAVVIIKNNPATPDAPIPPSTLSQAGNLSVATSNAWDSKAVMSAWWVNADQVSKTTPSGEYLTVGGFVIGGKKNFLPPAQLLLGFAIMFQISDESKARHTKHRILDTTSTLEENVASLDIEDDDGNEEMGIANEDGNESDSGDQETKEVAEKAPEAQTPHGNELDEGSDADNASDGDEYGSSTNANPLQSALTSADPPRDDEAEAEDDTKEDSALGSTQTEHEDTVAELKPSKDKSDSKGNNKRHLTARERRLLRKGRDPNADFPASQAGVNSDGEIESVTETVPPSVAPSTTTAGSKNKPLPRGKRAKQKRAAAKYAGQDEEDRALALQLLGSKSGPQVAETEAVDKKAKEIQQAEDKQRRREQHQRVQAAGQAAEAARRRAQQGQDADDDKDDDSARFEQVSLDSFIGKPLSGDEILAAIPVCAPWSALSTYKYKVKLQPGAQKKGKAVKEILNRWDNAFKDPRNIDKESKDAERIWPKEVELVKAWKDVEVFGVVPVGKVRIMLSGGREGGGGAAAKGKTKPNKGGRGSKKR